MGTATHKTVIDLTLETRQAEQNAERIQAALDRIAATAGGFSLGGGGGGTSAGVSSTGAARHPGATTPPPVDVARHPGAGGSAWPAVAPSTSPGPGWVLVPDATGRPVWRPPGTPAPGAPAGMMPASGASPSQAPPAPFPMAVPPSAPASPATSGGRTRQMVAGALGLHAMTQAGGLYAQQEVAAAQLSPETPFAQPWRAAGAATQSAGGLGMAAGLMVGGPAGLTVAAVGAIATIVGQQLSTHGELKGQAAAETYRNIGAQAGLDRGLAGARFRGGRGTMRDALGAAQDYDMSAQEVAQQYDQYTGAVGYRNAPGMLGVRDVARLSRAGVDAGTAGQYAGLSALGVQGGNVERLAAQGQDAGLTGTKLTGYIQAMASGISQMASQGMKVDADSWEALSGKLLNTAGFQGAPGQAQQFQQSLMGQRGDIRSQITAPFAQFGKASVMAKAMQGAHDLPGLLDSLDKMSPEDQIAAMRGGMGREGATMAFAGMGANTEAARAMAGGGLGPESNASRVRSVGYEDYERGSSASTTRGIELQGVLLELNSTLGSQTRLLQEIASHLSETRRENRERF